MDVKVWQEAGHEAALYGLSLSFKDRKIPVDEWWNWQDDGWMKPEKLVRMEKVAKKLAHREGGHNKFLESIMVWIDIEAPRYWWSEFDTYRVGITKQSESTMHTLSKRQAEQGDFEGGIDRNILNALNRVIQDKAGIQTIKAYLPESYKQRRMVCTNYKVLRNIIWQRKTHRLPEWQEFIEQITKQLNHPEYLP